jgi:hypothetical protein
MQVAVGVAGESRTLHSTCLSKTSPREDRGHIEVEPPQRGDNDDSKRSSNDHAGHELQAGTDADGDDGLAERDQDDQAVTLGEMLRRDSPSFSETEHGWTQVIDRKCQDPHPNAHIAADEGGSDKKRGADKFGRRDPEQRPAQVGVIAADSGVEDDVEYADSKKADTEDQSVLTESGRYRQRDTEQHRHRGQHREPDAAFVDVDRARQPGVAGPGPPDRSEHKQATKNSVPGRVVNQIEVHPYFSQPHLRRLMTQRGIATQAWSPIGGVYAYGPKNTSVLDDPVVSELAAKHGKTPAQIVLRWHIEQGLCAIPKSVKPHRIAENIDIFDFQLTPDEVAAIDALDTGIRGGPEPGTISPATYPYKVEND